MIGVGRFLWSLGFGGHNTTLLIVQGGLIYLVRITFICRKNEIENYTLEYATFVYFIDFSANIAW